jgi:hypothetical protein
MVSQMWHPEFKVYDINSIPELPMAALPQQPQHSVGHKSSSITDFVCKMG